MNTLSNYLVPGLSQKKSYRLKTSRTVPNSDLVLTDLFVWVPGLEKTCVQPLAGVDTRPHVDPCPYFGWM